MRIIKMLSQNRRDFSAQIQCESCGNIETLTTGYDDSYYHNHVLPNIKCGKCKKSTISANLKVEPQETKYPDGLVV